LEDTCQHRTIIGIQAQDNPARACTRIGACGLPSFWCWRPSWYTFCPWTICCCRMSLQPRFA